MVQYKNLVITICFAMTKNYFDAEDLAQETFLSAFRSLGKFNGENPKAWLTAIAVNKCKDYIKSPFYKNRSLSEDDLTCIADTGLTPEQRTETRSSEMRVKSLCGRLKEPYRSVADGYFCKGKKLSQISRETGENLKTLETRLYRSKKLLKALWKEEQENERAH